MFTVAGTNVGTLFTVAGTNVTGSVCLLSQGLPNRGVMFDRPLAFGRHPHSWFAVHTAFCQAVWQHVLGVEPEEAVDLAVFEQFPHGFCVE